MPLSLQAICEHFNLGTCQKSRELSSGLTNTLYLVETEDGAYAIKVIDSTSTRARSTGDYQTIEALNFQLKRNGLATIPARRDRTGSFTLKMGKHIIMTYPYWDGLPLSGPIGPIPEEHADKVGALLASLHQLTPKEHVTLESIKYHMTAEKWQAIIEQGNRLEATWVDEFNRDLELQLSWLREYEHAYARLEQTLILSHGDFCPHNILEKDGKLRLIDWELAGLINPATELMLALIMCSGFATVSNFNEVLFGELFNSYQQAGGFPLENADDAIWGAIGKGWFDWIYFNLSRSLQGSSSSEEKARFADNAIIALQSLREIIAKKEALHSLLQQTVMLTAPKVASR